jgi:hypothetical protein
MTFGETIRAQIESLRGRGRIVSVRIDGAESSVSPVSCTDHALTWIAYGDHPTESDLICTVNLALVREIEIEDAGPALKRQPG